MAGGFKTACAATLLPLLPLLPLLLLLTLPAAVQAQFNYTTYNGTITITGYTGPGGAVAIPSTTNGLPVTGIGTNAFDSCTRLTGITIPNGITGIGNYAFYGCTRLTSVTIPDSVTSIGNHAFDSCASLTNSAIGNGVTIVGEYAFSYCTNLTSITIPDSVSTIGSHVVSDCTSLTNVMIGNGVTNIGNGADNGCTSLSAITVGPLNSTFCSLDGVLFNKGKTMLIRYPAAKSGSFTIPTSVTYSWCWAFGGFPHLTSITIPNGVTRIGYGPFASCANLSAIAVDGLNSFYSSTDGVLFDKDQTTLIQCPGGKAGSYTIPSSVTSLGDYAFDRCTSLTTVTIPNSVTNLGNWTFSYCSQLHAITIPNGVTTLGNWAFASCTNLTSVMIPNSVTNIGKWTFFDCTGLKTITIPDSVTGIGDFAFMSCTSLTSVTIPYRVTTLGSLAFAWCASLTSVYFQGNAPSLDLAAFFGTPTTVYYRWGTTGWGETFGGRPAVLWNPPEALKPPAIISTMPAEMATGVPTTASVVFTFSKTMNTSPSVTFAMFMDSSLQPNNPSFLLPVAHSWSASNTVLTCMPNSAFPTNKTITWSVVGSDLAGNSLQTTNPAVLPGGFFTTGSVSEGTQAQPLILSMVPRNFGPVASPTAPIVFTFNKPMNPSVTAPVFIDNNALGLPPFYGILPTLPVWSAGNTVLTCTPIQGYPFPADHTITWNVSGTDLPGHLLVGQAGVFAPRSGGPNTNDTTSFTLTETCMYDQATAGAATLDPVATYVFGVTALVASNSPASSVSVTLPNNSVAELWGDSLTPKSFLWTEGITAPASFDATFPSGNYVFNLQGTTPTQRVTLNFPSGLIQPNAPHVNNFAAARAVNPALPFLLSWDPFQGAGTADIVTVTIGDHPVFTTVPPGGGPGTLNGTSTSVLIPAGTLQPNGHYDAFITFERVKVTNNSTNFTVVIRATITRFVLTTTSSTCVMSGVGVRTNRFGFTITGTSGLVIVVEACTNLANPIWFPVKTNTLTGDPLYFSDPQWTNYRGRFYRLRSP